MAVCVPTLDRPESVEMLLTCLAKQTILPDVVVVADASDADETYEVCRRLTLVFGDDVLHHVRAPRGLTLQRRVAIEHVQPFEPSYIAWFDDDVVLSEDYIEQTVGFLERGEGEDYGGVSGYDTLNWGKGFTWRERLYHRLRIYDGELRPGRWLYCGKFLQLNRLQRTDGVFDTDFLPGCLAVWRAELFQDFLPPTSFVGYGLGEDKHFSLRVAERHKLGVVCDALAEHRKVPSGTRSAGWSKGFYTVLYHGQILRDCDKRSGRGRYLAFLAVQSVDVLLRTAVAVSKRSWSDLSMLGGMGLGLLRSLCPPRRSADALRG